MAEIEHFVHPEKKDHPRFAKVADSVLPLFPKGNQVSFAGHPNYHPCFLFWNAQCQFNGYSFYFACYNPCVTDW